MSLRVTIARGITTAAFAAVLATGFAAPASAGTNGQQILFTDDRGDTYSVLISGHNQDGQQVSHCFSTPATDNYLSGWWWKGTVAVTGYAGSACSAELYNFGFTVPTNWSSDYYQVWD
ncbi:hypothetical protein [Streptomyces sp. NPDC048623]|uniref:hypothetical protein n=1 Tax=Streptomyces sp. NPDC048623 TaxID=3155761 RepID=UPI0034386241